VYRFFEIIPGFLVWLTIAAIFIFSYFLPSFVAVFIILFDIYWLLKTIFLSFHLRQTFSMMKKNLKIDWLLNLGKENPSPDNKIYWRDLYHLIILPFYKEPYDVIKETFDSLTLSNYPKEKFIIVLAAEESACPTALETAKKIKEEYASHFFKFLITVHPKNLPGEIPGKGSNEAWAGQKAKEEIIDKLNIPYRHVLVSVFDIDTRIEKNYFSILSYKFLTAENPWRASYQPIPLFTNNIFHAPSLARVISFSCTFWKMMQQARPERLTTFSSHSMPFEPLSEIGFWGRDLVSEDSHIFWQFYLHFNGNWKVIPLNYPVFMDANIAPTFWGTLKNLYKQQRRWAWGVENIPFMLKGFIKNKSIPFFKKLYWSFNSIEGFHSWATNALIIFALGWLPLLLGGSRFNYSLLSYSLPEITRFIMNLASIGIISSAVLSVLLLPPKPSWFSRRHYLLYLIEWVLMPITLIIFGSFPAIDAETRLTLGGKWRLGFWVTPKFRKK